MCERVMMRLVEEVHLDAIDTCARVYGFSASEAKSKIGNVVLMCGGVMEKKSKNPSRKKDFFKGKVGVAIQRSSVGGMLWWSEAKPRSAEPMHERGVIGILFRMQEAMRQECIRKARLR